MNSQRQIILDDGTDTIAALESERLRDKETIAKLREAVANYMQSEGCSCCQDIEEHEKHEKVLAELLDVPPYSDGSGYNFPLFRTEPK
jgi:hypothetical protein